MFFCSASKICSKLFRKLTISTADYDMPLITEHSYAMFDNNDQHELLLGLYRIKTAHLMLLVHLISPYCFP